MSTLHVLSSNGDDTLTWDATAELVSEIEEIFADAERNDLGRIKDADSAYDIALAEGKFREVKALGYRTHKIMDVTGTANDGEIAHKFDHTAAYQFAAPQTVGG